MAAPPTAVESSLRTAEQRQSAVIVFEDVSIAFESNSVLNGISFQLNRGETKAIFGIAGAGKSTILKLAMGLVKPDSGRIYVLGEDVTTMSEEALFELRRNIGIVFQESALFDSLTVRENVAFRLMEEHDVSDEEIGRRVAIARAIITHPEILLYDSPTGGLDPVTSTTIIQLIVKQRDVFKTSSLLVTHRLQDAFIMASHYFDRKTNEMRPLPRGARGEVPMTFLVLREGKIIFDGDAHELAHSKDEYIREYIS